MSKDYPFPLTPATRKKLQELFGTFEHPTEALDLTTWVANEGPDALQQVQRWCEVRNDVFELLDYSVQGVLEVVNPKHELIRETLEQLSGANFAAMQAYKQLVKIVRYCALTWQEDPLIRGTARKADESAKPVDTANESVNLDLGNTEFEMPSESQPSTGGMRQIPVVGTVM